MADDIGLADALLGLDGFRVVKVVEAPNELTVVVETTAAGAFCSTCGARAEAHERMCTEIRDPPCFGRPVRLAWSKRRSRCREALCTSKTWTEQSPAAPARLLQTARAGMEVTRQVGELARPVDTVAKENGLAWATTMDAVRYYGQPLVDAPTRVPPMRAMGVDETKWLAADGAHSTRYVSSIVDLDRCTVVDLIEGNTAADIGAWCAKQPQVFLNAVQVVATDLTESYRRGIQGFLDHALRVADPFHVTRVANHTVDLVRRRVQNQMLGDRGRKLDPLYRIRKLLAMGAERLSEHGHERVLLGLRVGDPDHEVMGAWLAKESVRDIYLTEDVEEAATLLEKAIIGCREDAVPEIRSLGKTLHRWRPEILSHHRTGASNGPTEGQNLCVKKVKRCGHGFRDFDKYRLRVLLLAGGVKWPHRPRPAAIR